MHDHNKPYLCDKAHGRGGFRFGDEHVIPIHVRFVIV